MDFSKKVVIAVITLNVLFTIAGLVVCWHTMQPIDALAVGFFAFTSTEVWALSKIKREGNKGGRQHADDFSETDEP